VGFCAEHSDIDCHPKKQSLTQQCVLLTEKSVESLKTRIMDHKWNLQSYLLRYYWVVQLMLACLLFSECVSLMKNTAHLRLLESPVPLNLLSNNVFCCSSVVSDPWMNWAATVFLAPVLFLFSFVIIMVVKIEIVFKWKGCLDKKIEGS